MLGSKQNRIRLHWAASVDVSLTRVDGLDHVLGMRPSHRLKQNQLGKQCKAAQLHMLELQRLLLTLAWGRLGLPAANLRS